MRFLALGGDTVPAYFSVDGHTYTLDVPKTTADGKIFMPSNFNIYCGICGDVWAKREVIHEPAMRWWAREMPCERCGHGFLWDHCDDAWNRSFNLALWERELELIHKYVAAGATSYPALFPSKNFRR